MESRCEVRNRNLVVWRSRCCCRVDNGTDALQMNDGNVGREEADDDDDSDDDDENTRNTRHDAEEWSRR